MTLDTFGKVDVLAVLDDAIENDRRDFGPPTAWRFSSLGKCKRQQYLARRNEVAPEPFTVKTLTLFRIGDLLEKQAVEWLSQAKGIQVISRTDGGSQIKVAVPEFNARGSLDGLVITDGEIAVLELKSTRDRALEYGDLPYHTHRLQALGYAYYLGLSRACIVYLGRDGAKKVFWETVTPAIVQEIQTQWAELERFWLAQEEPPRLDLVQATKTVKGEKIPFYYEKDGPWGKTGDPKLELPSECGYCSYQSYCWPAGEQR